MKDFINKCPCGRFLVMSKRKYCSKKCYNRFSERNSYESQKKRAMKMKATLIANLGGKCCKCGYDKGIHSLTFERKDGSEMLYPITITNLSNKSKISLVRETNKCNLICLNCQAESNNT